MKQLSYIIVFLLSTSLAMAAGVPQKFPTDSVQMGVGASSTSKIFTFDVNDGATNPKITVPTTTKDFNFSKSVSVVNDLLKVGNGVNSGTKVVEFNIGVANNPKFRYNTANSKLEFANNGVDFSGIGSGGGGGGGANWQPVAGIGPFESFEYSEKVWNFEVGALQSLTLWVTVPSSYTSGRQPILNFLAYSPSASNQFRFQAVTTLIRKNVDAVTSLTNQNTANGGDVTNALANRLTTQTVTLSSVSGTINSVAISAGDLIQVVLTRVAPGGTDDTADIRFIPSSTEVTF